MNLNYLDDILKYGIFIKFTSTKEYAEDLRHGIYMNSPHYYKQFEQAGTGDPDEIDDDYLIWCVSYIDSKLDGISWQFSNNYGASLHFKKEISQDILKMIHGDLENKLDPLGEYMTIIFNPMKYIGNLVKEFYSVNLKLSGGDTYGIVPMQFGSVLYEVEPRYNKRLFKKNAVYTYQHEFRLVLDIYKNNSENLKGFKTDFVDLDYKDLVVFKCSDVIQNSDNTILIPLGI